MTPKEQIEALGHTMVRDVLTAGDIARLREVALGHFSHGGTVQGLGRYQGSAASMVDGFETLLGHPGLLGAFREVLGDGQLVFTGSSDMHQNILNVWHRDSSALGADAWAGDYLSRDTCRIYRAGVYLQSHEHDGLGLNVKRGSHRHLDTADLPVDTLPNRAGDVVFIDSRTLHAGVLPNRFENILRGAGRRLGEPLWLFRLKELLWRASGKGVRLSMFVGFGLRNADTEEFCRFDMNLRRLRVGENCLLPPAVLAAVDRAGVVTYDAELARHFGEDVLRDFAAGADLPAERLWS